MRWQPKLRIGNRSPVLPKGRVCMVGTSLLDGSIAAPLARLSTALGVPLNAGGQTGHYCGVAKTIRIAIVGFGNVGRGVLAAVGRNPDMSLAGIISRDPERVRRQAPRARVFALADEKGWGSKLKADVAILCGGSAVRPAGAGALLCPLLQHRRQLRHPPRHPRVLGQDEPGREAGGQGRHHLDGVGPRDLLPRARARRRLCPGGRPLHLLGPRRQPGPLRRGAPRGRGQGRAAVHDPR